MAANLEDVRSSTYVLKWFEYGQGIIWCLHYFLDLFRARRHHYPSPESGDLE